MNVSIHVYEELQNILCGVMNIDKNYFKLRTYNYLLLYLIYFLDYRLTSLFLYGQFQLCF